MFPNPDLSLPLGLFLSHKILRREIAIAEAGTVSRMPVECCQPAAVTVRSVPSTVGCLCPFPWARTEKGHTKASMTM